MIEDLETMVLPFEYTPGDLALGALAALALAALLRLRPVALIFAIGLAGVILFALVMPDGFQKVSEHAAKRMTDLARSGALAGFSLASAAAAIIRAAIGHARPSRRARPRSGKTIRRGQS